jgi:hypothetical protein
MCTNARKMLWDCKILQNTAKRTTDESGPQIKSYTPYVILELADWMCHAPPRASNTRRCSRRRRLQSPESPLVHQVKLDSAFIRPSLVVGCTPTYKGLQWAGKACATHGVERAKPNWPPIWQRCKMLSEFGLRHCMIRSRNLTTWRET